VEKAEIMAQPARIFTLLALVGLSSAFTIAPTGSSVRPLTHSSVRSTPPRAALDPNVASDLWSSTTDMLTSDLWSSTTDMLAALPSLPGYGGSNAFSESASAQGSGLSKVGALAVGFPTILCVVVYKDNILSIFEPPPEPVCPPGWRKVESRSRPGKFSYENSKTGERYDRLPNWAGKE